MSYKKKKLLFQYFTIIISDFYYKTQLSHKLGKYTGNTHLLGVNVKGFTFMTT